MNMQSPQPTADIITADSVRQSLIETMRELQPSATRTEERSLEVLEAHYASHAFVRGSFSIKPTMWGFPELTFTGLVLGENITVSIWCY